MPCYNAAITLPEALASLSGQTFPNFEVVAVDDGSTDATPQILQEWAASDRRLHVVSRQHAGLIAGLNVGLEMCKAPYVARMDADDWSHPERLSRQVAYLEAHPEVSVVSCLVAGFPEGQVRQGFHIYIDWLNSLLSNEDIRREMFIESPLPHPSVVFRRQDIMQVGGYQDRGWAEDYDLWLRLYLAGVRFAKLPEILLGWREHPERLTRTNGRYSLENFLRAKAFYLARGPLVGRDAVIIWGAGMVGRRIAKQLEGHNAPLTAFVDIDPRKIGRPQRGLPIIAPEELADWWKRFDHPVILAAVGARGARQLIRHRLEQMGLREGEDWWGVS
jgi:glycosyltransferase involved in cell wall biosynthesis